VVTIPDIEKQGGNLTVECIIRGIQFAMKFSNVVKIRNLYIQLDNVSSNKCKKIKIHYLVVGHTHEDIDALTGNKFPPPPINII